MRRALVTGATSFTGRALTERLAAGGVETHALVRKTTNTATLPGAVRAHVYDGSAASMMGILAEVKPEVTYHFASLYLRDHTPEQIEPLFAANVTLGTQLVDALWRAGCTRLVNVGTFAQFYEADRPRALNLYAAAKEAFETVLAYYADLGMSVTTLVLFDTYGPGDTRAKLVPALFGALETGKEVSLPTEELVMDLTYGTDVAEAFALAGAGMLEEPVRWSRRRYAVSGDRISVRQLVEALEAVAGHRVPKAWGAWKLPPRFIATPWKGERPPGWTPRVSLTEGLRETLEARRRAR